MEFNVNVYCNSCHREGKLRLKKAVPEEEVRKKFPCPNCEKKSFLVYVSSMGRK